MSTNDDSALRRGRRAGQAAPDRRGPTRSDREEQWDRSSGNDRGAEQFGDQRPQQPRGYSFSRHSYTPPPPQQSPRPHESVVPPPSQAYFPEAPQRDDAPRQFADLNVPPYSPQQPYEPELPHPGYDDGGGDLFDREPPPLNYEQRPYAAQSGSGYQADPYDRGGQRQPLMQPAPGRRDDGHYSRDPREAGSPMDDYERSFSARIAAQESQASRFFLPEDQPQHPEPRPLTSDRGYQPAPMPQASLDRGYGQSYNAEGYNPSPELAYGQERYDPRHGAQEGWAVDRGLHIDDGRQNLPQRMTHRDELDEDFFADEDDLDGDPYLAPRRGRKKLIAAALVGAIAVGGGGAYVYKTLRPSSGDTTAFIPADKRPVKEPPTNPGGRQFPEGGKAIYDRLGPDGQQTQAAAYTPGPAPVTGNTLEDRIEEALKKARNTGDAPAQPPRPGTDQPTVVRSESYRPDGTRVDAARPVITPSIVNVNNGQLPPPFGNAVTPPVVVQAQAAPPAARPAPAPAAPAPQLAAATPPPKAAPAQPAPATGFYVSLKSAPDEKALQRELPALTDKYKSLLGDVTLSTRVVDLGAKGVMYRASAGPLSSKQEAQDLCQKIKGAGGACFVTN